MKGSSPRTSRKNRLKRLGFLTVGVVLAVWLLPQLFGFVAVKVFQPILSVETWSVRVVSIIPDYFTSRHELVERITDLETKIAYNTTNESSVARLVQENSELRQLLGAEGEARIAAGVIGRPSLTPYDVLVIDQGSNDGVVESAPVYAGADQAIGHVARVFPNSSIVVLASSPGVESTVYIHGPNIYTTARGQGGGVLAVSVPQGIPITTQDVVVMPSLGGGVYGRISVIDSVPTEPEQRGFVTLGTPIHSLWLVSVGREALAPVSFETAREVVRTFEDELFSVPVPDGVLIEVREDAAATSTATSTATTSDELTGETL